ncbi:glycosyltransferase family 2 protein [Candidatus Gottesmanbacteria bacterium]|nr:glycosyltransferase family 2 protein [Candidatus Gottesmanbacteria bacterium]
MNISVVISTYNRADSLARTLASLRPLDPEIIVIDNESSDATSEVAKRYHAKVFKRPNNLMLNVNKNFGFSKATGDWILCLDDDEELTPELAREIKDAIKTDRVAGFWIPRKNIIFGKWMKYGIWWPDRQLRLFRRGEGKYAEKHVHEYVEVAGMTETLTSAYTHHNYDSISQYLNKMQNIYTENELKKYEAAGYRVSWRDAVRFPVSDFLKLYFAQSGYKDGLHGLVLAMLQAFYSFVIFVKLWEKEKFREIDIYPDHAMGEFAHSGKEISYWITTTKIREATNPLAKWWYTIIRKVLNTP